MTHIFDVHQEAALRALIRDELQSAMAAVLADPQVDPQAKSLAGYLLNWIQRKQHDATV